MKNKKIIILFFIILISIVIVGIWAINYAKEKTEKNMEEYIPEEEISENQTRETMVSLYFVDKENKTIKSESRLVNVKDLINSPYNILIELLINGPKNEKLEGVIPKETKLLGTILEGESVIIDLSKEFLDYDKEKEQEKEIMLETITKTLTELKEVNSVKILVDGLPNEEFEGEYTRK